MRAHRYILRSLLHYRRIHLAACAGALVATAALTGALLTGHSVRRSLRDLAISRLGAADLLLASRTFFRDALAGGFEPSARTAPLLSFEAHVTLESTGESTGRRVTRIDLHGIDERFYRFHGAEAAPPESRDAFLSPALARELGARPGDTLLLRVEEPSAIPREFLYGDKEDTSRVLRFRVADRVTPPAVPEFALRQRQGDVFAVFVSLARLRRDLKLEGRANSVLLAGAPDREQVHRRLQEIYRLEDIGLELRDTGEPGRPETSLQHESTVLDDRTAAHAIEAGRSLHVLTRPFLTYLANGVRAGSRSSAYALIAGADNETLAELNRDAPLANSRLPAILLNQWLADDLAAQPGDEITLDYFVWTSTGQLETRSSHFQVSGIVPLRGLAADRRIAPEYPGITDQDSIAGWDPPFPIELKKITPRDEQYWKQFRATPKAWVPLDTARQLWGTRFGSLNTIRFAVNPARITPVLRNALDPLDSQFTLLPVREQALAASSGSTDFGEYFLYFSFVLVVAALVLLTLFFRLGVEQRAAEIRLLRSVGVDGPRLRLLFLGEGMIVAAIGALAGGLAGVAWAWLMMTGLESWWSGATGTTLLQLHVQPWLVVSGMAGGFAFSGLTIFLALRRHESLALRASSAAAARPRWFRRLWTGLFLCTVGALALLGLGFSSMIAPAGAFFGSAAFLLAAILFAAALWLRRPLLRLLPELRLWRLAVRNTAWRPARSLLCVALVALSAFLLVSLEAFRQHDENIRGIWAESLAPIVQDPHTLDGLPKAKWTSFRLRPGDDISCLNLYQPRNPQILGLPEAYYRAKPLRIAASLAQSAETRENPWLLLDSQLEQGHVPAIVDQNSLQYILHKRLGDSVEIERAGAAPLKLRIVATTAPGLFQSSILISEKDFTRLFPTIPGWRVFLIDAPVSAIAPLEEALAGYGFDARPLAEHLASFHRVENTYLSTFQALGGFGLLLGVAGLAAVMLRNALERQAELALLGAVGFTVAQLQRLILYENIALLIAGLGSGALCALLAVAPALSARAALLPTARILGLLVLIFAAGLLSSRLALRAATPRSLTGALRN